MSNKPVHTPVPAKIISGRNMAIFAVLFAISVMLGPTVKMSFEKAAEVSEMEDAIAGQQKEHTKLEKQASRWKDPNYIKQQARDRINMVTPGETSYWVVGAEEYSDKSEEDGTTDSENGEPQNWADRLMDSIEKAS